jgi:hypothetical protein
MTITEAVTRETPGIDKARRYNQLDCDKLTVIEAAIRSLELDDCNVVGDWRYHEPLELRDADPDVRRAAALAWLARHVRGLQFIARSFDDTKITKLSNDLSFGVELRITRDEVTSAVEASVPSALTCEMVETGEVEVIPAQTRPVVEKRCPPSIFAGVQEEVTL